MLVGKERHDLGRPNDGGYPVRAIRTPEYLYVRNYEPDRWPAGNPETGYRNCDNSPTKSQLLRGIRQVLRPVLWQAPRGRALSRRPRPGLRRKPVRDPAHAEAKRQLRAELQDRLEKDGDPRAQGNAQVFDTYKYTGSRRHAYSTWLEHNKL